MDDILKHNRWINTIKNAESDHTASGIQTPHRPLLAQIQIKLSTQTEQLTTEK
jgi:hypothetical protein